MKSLHDYEEDCAGAGSRAGQEGAAGTEGTETDADGSSPAED